MIHNKILLGAGVVVAIGLAFYGYGSYQHSKGRATVKQEHYLAELEQFKRQVEQLQSVSVRLQETTNHLKIELTETLKGYDHEVNQKPLHPDCTISDGRLRTINSIIEETSTARKSSETMPTTKIAK